MKAQGNNTSLYGFFSITSALIALVLFFVYALYALAWGGKIKEGLTKTTPAELKSTYMILRDPHIFAGYDRFDNHGRAVVTIIKYFDKAIYSGMPLPEESAKYLDRLYNRWEQGQRLTLVTALFALILSVSGMIFYFIEKRRLRV